MKSNKIALLTVLSMMTFSLPVLAHEGHDADEHEHTEGQVNEQKPDMEHTDEHNDKEESTALKSHMEMSDEHDHKHEDTDYTRVYKEGTLNLISPFTFNQDTLYLLYSHNYLLSTIPRGSNPAFHFSYVPIKNLQLDTIFSLRYSPLEWEIGAKYQLMNQFEGAPISLAPRVAYNTRGNVLGVDIAASRIFFGDILQVALGYRALGYFGDPKIDNLTSNFEHGLGISATVRAWKHWYLFGDMVLPYDWALISNHGFVWSAGIKKRLPHTPHIITLYVGNSNESTLTGRTISTGNGKYPDMLKFGFQFSIGIPSASKFPERLF